MHCCSQVVDSGLDQESCFFRDEDGENVELGYYFDEIALLSATDYFAEFNGGYFPADLNRRKVGVIRVCSRWRGVIYF